MEKVDFKNLNKLDLSWNKISNINIFKKVDFKELNDLCLGDNEINEKENYLIITNLKSKIKKFII